MLGANEAVADDRAMLANAFADGVAFIAIAEGSASAVVNPMLRKQLLLLGDMPKGLSAKAQTTWAKEQARRKCQPWQTVIALWKLVPVDCR